MKTYTVHFRAGATYAIRAFAAGTPAQALAAAQAFYAARWDELDCERYDEAADKGYPEDPVNEIAVEDKDGREVALWQADELRLRIAAPELLTALEGQTEAAQAVIDHWAKGDLAAAVRSLDAWIAPAREAIAKAKGEEP
jgi:hypothetical protein